MSFKYMALWQLAKMAYSTILRSLLKTAIDNPDEEWDDMILQVCDRIFEYSE